MVKEVSNAGAAAAHAGNRGGDVLALAVGNEEVG